MLITSDKNVISQINIFVCQQFWSIFFYYLPLHKGPGQEILNPPPPPSVCLSVRLETRKRIDIFSRNFAGMCTMSWGCVLYSFWYWWDVVWHFWSQKTICLDFFFSLLFPTFLEKQIFLGKQFFLISCFLHVLCYFQHLKKIWTCWREIWGDRVALFFKYGCLKLILCMYLTYIYIYITLLKKLRELFSMYE